MADDNDDFESRDAVPAGGILGGEVPLSSAPLVVPHSESERQTIRIPQQLSEHYHKARRNLVVAAALLLAWSTVGLSVSEMSTEGAKLIIERPELIPLVLRASVGYFLFRMWLEFQECDPERTKRWAPRVDVGVSTLIGVAALASPWLWENPQYTLLGLAALMVGGTGYAAFKHREILISALRDLAEQVHQE